MTTKEGFKTRLFLQTNVTSRSLLLYVSCASKGILLVYFFKRFNEPRGNTLIYTHLWFSNFHSNHSSAHASTRSHFDCVSCQCCVCHGVVQGLLPIWEQHDVYQSLIPGSTWWHCAGVCEDLARRRSRALSHFPMRLLQTCRVQMIQINHSHRQTVLLAPDWAGGILKKGEIWI